MTLKNTPYGPKGPAFKDLTGKRFDKLLVIDYVGYNGPYKTSIWKCLCDCGKEIIRQTNTLIRFKNFHSCGCTGTRPVLPNNQHAFKRMYNTYKQNAQKRGYVFNLNTDQFREIIIQKCFYCDSEPLARFSNCTVDPILANGVDRMDNDRNYDLDNCVPCCKDCNRAKHQMTTEEFLKWVSKVYKFNFDSADNLLKESK